ncbi:carbohydrate-binding protein [Flavobacterium ovatum]|uniref:carbohydrate-binding protein n=1 Tax=Flavobacterium ovatum TaxID=1928857 RepID=UPI00344D479B
MNFKNIKISKSTYLILFFTFFLLSCEREVEREVVLYDKGKTEATASKTSIDFGQSVDFTSTSFKVLTTNWTFKGGSPATSINPNVKVSYSTPGTFDATLVVKYIDNTVETVKFTIVVKGIDAALPYSGTAVAIPGTFEAENYDKGGEGVGYHDNEVANLAVANGSTRYRTDDGVDVEVGTPTKISYTNAGEWVNYAVNVANDGFYDFEFKVASGNAAGGKSIKLQSVNISTGQVTDLGQSGNFSFTGGNNVFVSKNITGIALSKGLNTLRLFFTGSDTNLDKVNVIVSLPPAPIDGVGIYTERDIVSTNAGIAPPPNNGNFSITTVSTNTNHGSKSLFYHYDPTGNGSPQTGFALSHMDLTTSPYNASAYGFLNIAVKSTTPKNVRIRLNTNAGNFWVTLKPAVPAYGMLWDGAWHELVIPFSDILLNGSGAGLSATPTALSSIKQFTVRTDDSDYTTAPDSFDYYIDDIYFTKK